jgi:hypothetical protein
MAQFDLSNDEWLIIQINVLPLRSKMLVQLRPYPHEPPREATICMAAVVKH